MNRQTCLVCIVFCQAGSGKALRSHYAVFAGQVEALAMIPGGGRPVTGRDGKSVEPCSSMLNQFKHVKLTLNKFKHVLSHLSKVDISFLQKRSTDKIWLDILESRIVGTRRFKEGSQGLMGRKKEVRGPGALEGLSFLPLCFASAKLYPWSKSLIFNCIHCSYGNADFLYTWTCCTFGSMYGFVDVFSTKMNREVGIHKMIQFHPANAREWILLRSFRRGRFILACCKDWVATMPSRSRRRVASVISLSKSFWI